MAFCDLIKERAEAAKAEFGTEDARVYTDYQELLREELDAVYVLTPNNSHAPISIAAMKAGKHVMCEKPMAKTYKEAKEMLDTSERTGMKLTIGYQSRWRADSLYLKKMCEDGELGEIYYGKAIALRRITIAVIKRNSAGIEIGLENALSAVLNKVDIETVKHICAALGAANHCYGLFRISDVQSPTGFEHYRCSVFHNDKAERSVLNREFFRIPIAPGIALIGLPVQLVIGRSDAIFRQAHREKADHRVSEPL